MFQDKESRNALIKAARELCTGRWQYDQIHACISGKDADLDAHGYQGIEILDVIGDQAKIRVHVGKTVCGEPTPDAGDLSDLEYEFLREYMLENLQEIVNGCPMSGYWSGDDWFLSAEIDFNFELVLNDAGTECNFPATAQAVIDYVHSCDGTQQRHPMHDVIAELNYMDNAIDGLYRETESEPHKVLVIKYAAHLDAVENKSQADRRRDLVTQADYHLDRAACHISKAEIITRKIGGTGGASEQLAKVMFNLTGYSIAMFAGLEDKAHGCFDDDGNLESRTDERLTHYHKIHDALSDVLETGRELTQADRDTLADLLATVPAP